MRVERQVRVGWGEVGRLGLWGCGVELSRAVGRACRGGRCEGHCPPPLPNPLQFVADNSSSALGQVPQPSIQPPPLYKRIGRWYENVCYLTFNYARWLVVQVITILISYRLSVWVVFYILSSSLGS